MQFSLVLSNADVLQKFSELSSGKNETGRQILRWHLLQNYDHILWETLIKLVPFSHAVRTRRTSGFSRCAQIAAQKELFPQPVKPALLSEGLCGTEGPLFHGDPHIRKFFGKLWSRALPKTFPRTIYGNSPSSSP